ncbi:site-specific integrase [Embleya sp. NBC_00888]|uniref:site-specific integrase n=1 Tax=Embleya sp. NBC_00888 TaxID=2975960 RepID=UPI00386531FA|nr:site-specific integrase [Embleya sp. NBC_00888]
MLATALPDDAEGNQRKFRRMGYGLKEEAQTDLDKVSGLLLLGKDDPELMEQVVELLLKIAKERAPIPDYEETAKRLRSGVSLTKHVFVGDYLDEWLAGKRVRKGTVTRYECDIRVHLKPRIGDIRLDRLRIRHLSEMFTAIADANEEVLENNAERRRRITELKEIPWKGLENRAKRKALKDSIDAMPPFRRITGPATRARIRGTLRAALNDAIPRELITLNPAAHVELDPVKKPKPLVWTPERVAKWRETGIKPSPVMVWTPEQTGKFLDHVADDALYAFWDLLTFRGLRRGEGCGLRLEDLHLESQSISVLKQLVQDGWTVVEDDPKTDESAAEVALDTGNVKALEAHLKRRNAQREKWGEAWVESGRVFTQANGEWLHPGWVSARFTYLVEEADLPPIRLHDLRHCAATLAHAAGADIKTISAMLRHSSIKITGDIYTSVLSEAARAAAEATMLTVPRAANAKAPKKRQLVRIKTAGHTLDTSKVPESRRLRLV